MNHLVIPQHISIESFRSSGYRDGAHAVAELIDNSIQAGESLERAVSVEVICVDKSGSETESGRRRLDEIGVYDDAVGMTPDTLRLAMQFGGGTHRSKENQHGIGKFGMGLPNSSISQAKRVDVWSWRDGETYHTYLDVDEIADQRMDVVPEPQVVDLPTKWTKLLKETPKESGTLVVWSRLDRMQWRQSNAFIANTEKLIGRIYRHYLLNKKASIRLAAFEKVGAEYKKRNDIMVRPNDPLFLMLGTNAPEPFDKEAAFVPFGEPHKIKVLDEDGTEQNVKITLSVVKSETRSKHGSSDIGKLAKYNQGISVVRSGRELEINKTFENSYDTRERWWGVEVDFPPALDNFFGVTNTKQAATNFKRMDREAEAVDLGMTVAEFNQHLADADTERAKMFEISTYIERQLSNMQSQIQRMAEGARERGKRRDLSSGAEFAATRATRKRQEEGTAGQSDEGEKADPTQRASEIAEEFEKSGQDHESATELASEYVESGVKFHVDHVEVSGGAIFDVSSKAGVIFIHLNTRHPAHSQLIELLRRDEEEEEGSKAMSGLKLLLSAWARMEDEAIGARKTALEDARSDWGRIARDFMNAADEF